MTIAVCYLSPEGVVLGADSTTTSVGPDGYHYFNHGQKIFEVGEGTSFGIVTWGLAGFGAQSYRTLVAHLGDDMIRNPANSVDEVAKRFADILWTGYQNFSGHKRFKHLEAQSSRSPEEDDEYGQLQVNLVAGFCLAGHSTDRKGRAFQILLDPLKPAPDLQEIPECTHRWWGVPNIVERVIYGGDPNLYDAIANSGKWSGTPQELTQIFQDQALSHPILPMREAVDFVHTCIRSTGKAMRYSQFPQVCGGPPEIAVITTDRNFRWVRHKQWDTAIEDGG